MDPSEASFRWLVRWWLSRFGRDATRANPAGGVELASHLDRLELLTAMLFGDRLRLVPATDDVGGIEGGALLLPRMIALDDREAVNLEVYRYRIAWAAATRSSGLEGAVEGRDPVLDGLATLLAVGSIQTALHRDLPGSIEATRRLGAVAARARPPGRVFESGGLLEALVLRLLGVADPYGGSAPTEVEQWLDDAISRRPETGAALIGEARRLLPQAIALSGRSDPPPPVLLWGRLLPRPRSEETAEAAITPDDDGSGSPTVVELNRTLRLERSELGEREDRPLYHMFEKLETAEEYGGETATPDASGSADQMQDALRELALGTVVRTAVAPRNLVRAEVIAEPTSLEVGSGYGLRRGAFQYPEWDHRRSSYRRDWCTVFEERYLSGEAGPDNLARVREILQPERRHVEAIRGHLLRTLYRRRMTSRQTEGPEIDVEAMVERHADLASGRTPPERLYRSARKSLRDVAILVLLDASWSTDAWLEGRRVLDIELSSLLVVAEAFEGYLEDEVGVASFCSHTRNDVRFGVLKSFEDPWMQLRRIAPSLRPDGYTRIGAAIRHATAVLETARASKKLLLLLSDGKPTDFDRYEGSYGTEDVRHAIREARERRLHPFGIAIEKEAKLYLARMLGRGHYRVLPRPSLLPDVMAEVFASAVLD